MYVSGCSATAPEFAQWCSLDGVHRVAKQLKLRLRERNIVLVCLVGDGKVREYALNVEVFHAAAVGDALHAAVKMPPRAQNAEARHSAVHLDMHAQGLAESFRLGVVLLRLCKAGDGLGDAVFDEVFDLLARGVTEDEYGHTNAVCAQLHRLVKARDREIIRAELLKHPANVHRAVTVSVGLHDAEKFNILPDARAQHAAVVLYCVKVDFRPSPAES